MNFIGQNLRYLRKQTNLSQQAFAEKIGLNRGNIASYEKGLAEPNSSKLIKITNYFKVDLADFINKDLSIISEQNHEVSIPRNAKNHKIHEDTLTLILKSLGENEEDIKPVQVLIESSMDLGKILEGFKNYHNFRSSKILASDMSPIVQKLIVDYETILEVADDLKEINRQLIKIIISDIT